MRRKLALFTLICVAAFGAVTWASLKPVEGLARLTQGADTRRITGRDGEVLSATYQNRWNSDDQVRLYEMPELLKQAFIISEDRRFYEHGGVDWRARGGALWQNVRYGRVIRGASTISEQVVRMVNPRPRNIWSKWLEGFEAAALDGDARKADILEFYLNQVPYAANRRGVAQGARYYFNRDLGTLTQREMLALVVLARAPSAYDLYRNPAVIDGPLARLADDLQEGGVLNAEEVARVKAEKFELQRPSLPVDVRHFARYVRGQAHGGQENLRTTLNPALQKQVEDIIAQRVAALNGRKAGYGAALVADHKTGEILAWVSTGNEKWADIDAVTMPRQPGSAMKPFLYAAALDKGWNAATIIEDSPLTEAVGAGLHRFRNYSGQYHGAVTLREALGNSLNIPAVRAIHYVGPADYLELLHHAGFESLDRGSQIYDEGLALGNGEVTLLELTAGYAALANKGVYRPLRFMMEDAAAREGVAVFTPEAASLTGNILSDPAARRLEFGRDSVLNYTEQVAVKTGTSTDFRDAWVAGYNDRYVVGIWIGNPDYTPMEGVTGSTGPALALRSIFSILNRGREVDALYMSERLAASEICTREVDAETPCLPRTEWFMPGSTTEVTASEEKPHRYELVQPTDGLQMAYDPRVPAESQKFRFEMTGVQDGERVEWVLNGTPIAGADGPRHLWPVARGAHTLQVGIIKADGQMDVLPQVKFTVK